RAPWRLAAIQRGLCILERKSFSSREVHQLAEWDALVRFEIIELSSLIIIDYHGSFQQLLGVHQLHLEASVQPLMTRHGGVECALFLELRLGQSLTESAWVHVLVWCGLEAFPGDCRGCAEPEEPMSAMQLRLPKGCVCSSLQRVARGSLLQQALTSHGTVRTLLAFEPCKSAAT
ncbi:Uncharacterized protein SCF082_LOCUS14609, partial [Durusdinium trenchii]